MSAQHLVVRGKVQRVWYRDWTVSTAQDLGLTGWVRNRDDGTVEAWLEGDDAAISQMIAAMHDGPPRASVDQIDSESAQPEGFTSFDRR